MTVQPEDINELERMVHEEDEAAQAMIVAICEKQPHLHEWLVAKFNALISKRALLGIALSSMVLMQEDRKVLSELIKTVNILSDQSDLSCIVNSFDDTLTDEEIFVQIQEWNNANSR